MRNTPTSSPRIINRKARFNYEILERLEAGIALMGSEVKSLRAGKASLDEAYAFTERGVLMLLQCNISPYENAGYAQHAPTRPRKLLLHTRELRKWLTRVKEQGYSIIPTSIYFNERGIAKVELALGKGKTAGDKRNTLKERESKREMDRAMKRR